MKNKPFSIIVKITLILLSCVVVFFIFTVNDSNPNPNTNKFINRCKIEYIGDKCFELDDETSYLSSYIQFIDNDTARYFTFTNEYNNSIYFYDYTNSAFIKKIKYEKEGNNGVGEIQGYDYINDDSIFVYAYRSSRMFLTNSNSSVINSFKPLYKSRKYNSVKEMTSFPPAPYAQSNSPIRFVNGNVILAGLISGEYISENSTNRPVSVIYNLTDKSIKYRNNYPEIYQEYNWGGGLTYRMPFFETNKNNIILSFAADHYIENYSLISDSSTRYYAGSSAIDKITPFRYPKSVPQNNQMVMDWYRENPSYEGIYYDKYKDLYYRIARLPNKNYKRGDFGNRKPIIIIVLDSKLNYLGEGKLPVDLNLNTTNCFVTKDGFHIQLFDDNEDSFTFCKFEIEINS